MVLDFAAARFGVARLAAASERVLALELVLFSEVVRVSALITVSEAVVLEAADSAAADLEDEALAEEGSVEVAGASEEVTVTKCFGSGAPHGTTSKFILFDSIIGPSQQANCR